MFESTKQIIENWKEPTWKIIPKPILDENGLLPCPFCGRKAQLVQRAGGWDVSCYYNNVIHAIEDNKEICEVECSTALCLNNIRAVRLWNTRKG